jgi:hypothetical protein
MNILVVAIWAGGHLPSSWDHESYHIVDVKISKIALKNKLTTTQSYHESKAQSSYSKF